MHDYMVAGLDLSYSGTDLEDYRAAFVAQ